MHRTIPTGLLAVISVACILFTSAYGHQYGIVTLLRVWTSFLRMIRAAPPQCSTATLLTELGGSVFRVLYRPPRLSGHPSVEGLIEHQVDRMTLYFHDGRTPFIFHERISTRPWFVNSGGEKRDLRSGETFQVFHGFVRLRNGMALTSAFNLWAASSQHPKHGLMNIRFPTIPGLLVAPNTPFPMNKSSVTIFNNWRLITDYAGLTKVVLVKVFTTASRTVLALSPEISAIIPLLKFYSYRIVVLTAANLSCSNILRLFNYASTLSTVVSEYYYSPSTSFYELLTAAVQILFNAYPITSIIPLRTTFSYKAYVNVTTAATLQCHKVLRTPILKNIYYGAALSTAALFRFNVSITNETKPYRSRNSRQAIWTLGPPNSPPKPRPLQPTRPGPRPSYTNIACCFTNMQWQ